MRQSLVVSNSCFQSSEVSAMDFADALQWGGGGWGLLAFGIGGIVAIDEIVISRLACTQLCEWLRKALG